MRLFGSSEMMLLEHFVRWEYPYPFGFSGCVRENESRGCYQVVVTTSPNAQEVISSPSETLFSRGDFSPELVTACRDTEESFMNMIRDVIHCCCLDLMDLVLDQEWVALGGLLGGA